MYAFCRDNGFSQHVRGPTFGHGSLNEAHLLDLVLSDFECSISIEIAPEIEPNSFESNGNLYATSESG